MLFSYPIILCVIPTCCSLALFSSVAPCLVMLVAVATSIIGYIVIKDKAAQLNRGINR